MNAPSGPRAPAGAPEGPSPPAGDAPAGAPEGPSPPAGDAPAGAARALDLVAGGAAVAVVSGLAAARVGDVAEAARDASVERVLGLGAGVWRALEPVVGQLLCWLPLGTRAARAALASTAAAGVAAAVAYALTRRLLSATGGRASAGRLGGAIAALAVVAAAASPPWQGEASAVGGAGFGALLVLLPLLFAFAARGSRRWEIVAGTWGLALGHEPLAGLCAFAGCAALIAVDRGARESLARKATADGARLGASVACGLLPWIVSLVHTRAVGVPVGQALAEGWAGERGAVSDVPVGAFVHAQIGAVVGTAALAGLALAWLVPRARPLAAALAALVLVGLGSSWLGAPIGPARCAAPALAALVAAYGLAAVTMQAIVRAVAAAKLPFARGTAAMVLLLEAVLPVDAVDDALATGGARAQASARSVESWDDAVWSPLPPRSVVILGDARLALRARAARAQAALRDDVIVVDLAPRSSAWRREVGSDPALLPLWRDLALAAAPTEASLSSLASRRPLFAGGDVRWTGPVGRHVVPASLLDRFEPEPRGASDRRRALDAFAPAMDALLVDTAADVDLRRASERLLLTRATLLGASGERDVADRAAVDAARWTTGGENTEGGETRR